MRAGIFCKVGFLFVTGVEMLPKLQCFSAHLLLSSALTFLSTDFGHNSEYS